MSSVTQQSLHPTIPPTVHKRLHKADQHLVTYLPVTARPLGTCSFCPPGDPARPATAQLLYIDRDTGLRVRDVGGCCIVDALHQAISDHGNVTVLNPPAAGR